MTSKSDRLNLRIEPELRELFETAAAAAKMTLSSFILSAVRTRAEQQLADRVDYSVTAEQWQVFMEALDRPPRKIPRLERLLAKPARLGGPDASED